MGIPEARVDYGHQNIISCPGDARCRPAGRSLLVCRVERQCFLNRSPRRLPVSLLVAGTTFDKVYYVVACTGVLGIDVDMSPRSADRRRSIGVGVWTSTAPGSTAWKRTTIFDGSSGVVQMTSHQIVAQVVIVTVWVDRMKLR